MVRIPIQTITHIKTVSNDIHCNTPVKKPSHSTMDTVHSLSTEIGEGVEHTVHVVQHAADVARNAAHRVSETAREACQTASEKASHTMANSKECVRRHPVSMVLGAVVFGAAVGYLVMGTRRKPGFRERHVEEPLLELREAIQSVLSPVTRRLHQGYGAACDGVGKAIDQVHRHSPGHSSSSVSDRLSQVGKKIKFW